MPVPPTKPLVTLRRSTALTTLGLAAALAVILPVVACSRDSSVAACPPAPAAAASVAAPWRTWRVADPIIDSHVHITPTMTGLAQALEIFDQAGVGPFVVKSAGQVGSPKYAATLAMQRVLGDRMRAFANLDWTGIDDPSFAQRQVRLLAHAKQDGIVGIKIFKALGLAVRTSDGRLLAVDDPRLDPIFDACGRLGLIVAWHVADPVAFFKPVTPDNERYEELRLAPDWSFYGKDYPSHDALIEARDRVIARHPNTVFLLIHLANYPENLDYVDSLLDAHPNVYVDTSARVPEFGRHPADKVRAFFVKHQGRILFGSDFIAGADGAMQLGSTSKREPVTADGVEFFLRHWRYFETQERQIDHPTPIQGNWKVDAIGLPVSVLRKLYVTNARKLLFSGEAPRPHAE